MSNNTPRVALVTGAAAGIGRATALAYADAGCDVVVADVNNEAQQSLAEEIKGKGRRVLAREADMGNPDDI